MIQAVIYFLPSIVSLLWAVIYSIRDDGKGSTAIVVVQYLSFGYFATLAMYISPLTDPSSLYFVDILSQLLAFLILIFNLIFIHSLNFGRRINPLLLATILFISVAHVLILTSFYYVIGTEKASEFLSICNSYTSYSDIWTSNPEFDTTLFHNFVIVDRILFEFVCGLYALWIMGVILVFSFKDGKKPLRNMYHFFLKNGELQRVSVINFLEFLMMLCMGLILVLGRVYLFSSPAFSIVMSLVLTVLLFLLAISVYNTDNQFFHSRDLFHFHMAHTVMDGGPEASLKQANSLESRLERCLEQDDVHLDPDMTLDVLAEKLGTNHTTLSYLINHNYGMNFRDLLAKKRIMTAKDYLIAHPLASMEEVAFNSGFNSQAVFFRRFKEMTGQTPKGWLHSQVHQ